MDVRKSWEGNLIYSKFIRSHTQILVKSTLKIRENNPFEKNETSLPKVADFSIT